MEIPIKLDDFGGTTIFGNTQISCIFNHFDMMEDDKYIHLKKNTSFYNTGTFWTFTHVLFNSKNEFHLSIWVKFEESVILRELLWEFGMLKNQQKDVVVPSCCSYEYVPYTLQNDDSWSFSKLNLFQKHDRSLAQGEATLTILSWK